MFSVVHFPMAGPRYAGRARSSTVLLSEVVATSGRVASTRARSAKVAALAELFRALGTEAAGRADVIEVAVAALAGEPRQGKIGVGWATLFGPDRRHPPPAGEPSLTIEDLDTAIAQLAATSGAGSVALRRRLLDDLLGRATAEEQDLIRRLLTGEVRQGALEGLVTEAVAAAAAVPLDTVRRAAMFAGSLPAAAGVAFAGGAPALQAIGLEPLRPVLPMLASPAPDVATALADAGGVCSIEWKLDGARIQAHRRGADVRLFTRNLNDVTARLPAVAAIVVGLPADTLVLDGEVLGVGSDERPDRFQDTMSRFSRHDGAGGDLTVAFFDVLHADGADLVDRPLFERVDVLDRVARLWRIRSILTSDVDEALAFEASALDLGHEGVMVKAAGSLYEAGRRGKAWRKVKPVHTFDLVVLAAEWGYGRRQGWLSNIHLGALDPPGEFGPAGGLVMVGKTFKGMTDALLTWQTERFQELATETDGHVVRVRPEVVVEVAVDGVQASTRYAGGVALRFARVRHYRDDKTITQADTIQGVRQLLRLG
jgi:DNA ligase-1